jgi:hypothetical protein
MPDLLHTQFQLHKVKSGPSAKLRTRNGRASGTIRRADRAMGRPCGHGHPKVIRRVTYWRFGPNLRSVTDYLGDVLNIVKEGRSA